MVRKIEGYESRDGSLCRTLNDAVRFDLQHEVSARSDGEARLEPVAASYMVENAEVFIGILEQMPGRCQRTKAELILRVNRLTNALTHATQRVKLISIQDQGAGGTLSRF